MKKQTLVLILLASVLFFFKLGSFSLYDAAETTYGEFVKGILTTGDWLTLHFNGQIIFDKPPLYYWLVAILSKLIGFSEFSMRFWAALSGVLTVVTTYFLGKKFYNERTGFLSAIIVMTAFQFLVQSRIAELDIVLCFFILLSLFLFYRGYTEKKRKDYLYAYFPMGLAMLIKGVLGVALPLFTIFLFLLIKKELGKIREMFPVLGLVIIALIGLPWYIAEYLIHGKVFLDFALGFLFLSRFQGVVSGHTGPWYYYFIALLLGFAPWSQFLPLAFWKTFKDGKSAPSLLILCLVLPAFLVFSIAKTKIPNYILPLYPFLAIMVGKLWNDFLDNPKVHYAGFLISNLSLLVVIGLLMFAAVLAGQNYSGPYAESLPLLNTLAGILMAGSLLSILFFLAKKYLWSFALLPIMVFAIAGYLTLQVLPAVEKYKGTRELCAEVTKVILPDESIAAFDVGNRPGVVFYNSKPIVFLKSESEAISFLNNKRGYCFTHVSNFNQLKPYGQLFSRRGELAVFR